MTATTAPTSTPTLGVPGGTTFGHLLRAEYLKIRTTNIWWLFGMFTVLATALALLVNILTFHFSARPVDQGGTPDFDVVSGAAAIFTSGQFFGAMFALLLAILTITNEYHHQTVTTTFLATPHRTSVISAKFVISMLAAGLLWLFTTVIDLIVGSIYFSADGYDSHLGDAKVVNAMLLSLLVFALWAVFGVGLGVLLRSQIGATVTGALLYTVGLYLAIGIFSLIHQFLIKKDWVLSAMVIVPAIAAQVAITPSKIFPQSPAQWVGVVVMLGYGVVFGVIGVYYTRKRDIS
ncbi:MAG TPA: ABC transporter permease subunit [Rugosimonospora sp.]|nr:ABC transporter permease subunit [Rugosimonospora sp.]